MRRNQPMGAVFVAFARRKGVEPGSLRFFLGGERFPSEETPASLGLEDDEQVDVMLEQGGD
jgi:small ubiquitin-related modifier